VVVQRQAVRGDAVSRAELVARLESAEGADCYAVLELNATCSPDQIRSAYYYLARRYHPDRFRAGPLSDLRERTETYFSHVTEAYNTLIDPRLRAAYDEQREAPQEGQAQQDPAQLARQNYARARLLIDKGRYSDAVVWLQNAITLDGQHAIYHLELGKLLTRNPRMRADAERHLVQANRIDPTLAEGYLALGELYLKSKRKSEAVKQFRETLRWEPGHIEAAARLKELGERVKA
jgi:curved DNA-binding protein CbpA